MNKGYSVLLALLFFVGSVSATDERGRNDPFYTDNHGRLLGTATADQLKSARPYKGYSPILKDGKEAEEKEAKAKEMKKEQAPE